MIEQSTDLSSALTTKQKELDIVLAIDRIRDTASGPIEMFSGIVDTLVDLFQADLGLLYLINRESGDLEMVTVKERDKRWAQIGPTLTRQLARQVLDSGGLASWRARDVLSSEALAKIAGELYLAAIPIVLESPLGALFVVRTDNPFDDGDLRLLQTAESQIDSAVIQAYTHHELAQRNKELETIYQIDRIRDQNLPFDDMLNIVLQELCAIIDADMGFVMLYNQVGKQLEMRAYTDQNLLDTPIFYKAANQAAQEALQRAEMVCFSQEGDPSCYIMCVPLILREEIIGVFGAVNHYQHRGFTKDDRRLLKAVVSQMDTAIMESLERRRLSRVLSRSVDPQVLDRLLADPNVDILEGERFVLTVLYGDLRGSTQLAENLDPALLVDFINDWLTHMTDVLLSHGGTLDKFIGDEIMAIFGAPIPQPDHALRAVRVGLDMQIAHQAVLGKWAEQGVEAAQLGVGIATGELTVGEIGCEQRTDYTVIGRAANLGARICGVAKGGQVLIAPDTYEIVQDRIEATSIPELRFKGIDHPVTVYRVTRLLD